MQNILKTLNDTISRTTPNCHPLKRAMLINRVLEIQKNKRAIQRKLLRADWFIVVSRPSEDKDYHEMYTLNKLFGSFAA